MMKKYLAFAAASLIGLAGVAAAADAVAQNNPHAPHAAEGKKAYRHTAKMHPKGGLPRELQELNLSAKQKAEIQKIMEANRPQAKDRPVFDAAKHEAFKQKMQQQRTAEHNLITAKRFDEAAARRLIEERQAGFEQNAAERKKQMADMEVKRLQERHAVFQVLTPKQQKQLLDNQQKRREERARRRAQRIEPHLQESQPAPQN